MILSYLLFTYVCGVIIYGFYLRDYLSGKYKKPEYFGAFVLIVVTAPIMLWVMCGICLAEFINNSKK